MYTLKWPFWKTADIIVKKVQHDIFLIYGPIVNMNHHMHVGYPFHRLHKNKHGLPHHTWCLVQISKVEENLRDTVMTLWVVSLIRNTPIITLVLICERNQYVRLTDLCYLFEYYTDIYK